MARRRIFNPGTNFVITGNTVLNDRTLPLFLYNTTTTAAQDH